MNIDDIAKRHLFDYARSKGFTGTADEWHAEFQQHAYATAVREFCAFDAKVALHGHEDLQRWVSDVCARALSGFERVHTSLGNSRHAHISFSGRRTSHKGGLRLQYLTIDIDTQENRSTVRLQGYVDGKLQLARACSVLVDWEAKA